MTMFNYQCDENYQKIKDVSQNYPQLTTFEKEWLFFDRYGYIPGLPVELEYQTVQTNDTTTVLNAIPYHYKSAILKGNTLVNIAQITSHNFDSNRTPVQDLNKSLETGKQYTIIMNIVSQTTTQGVTIRFGKNRESYINVGTINGVGLHKLLFSATNDFNQIAPYIKTDEWNAGLSLEYNQLMIIEGDYTNVDIPYFEGMQSVKMPVLTTVGKNLFDISKVIKNSSFSTNGNTIVYTSTSSIVNISIFTGKSAMATPLGDFEGIKVSPNTEYTLTNESNTNFRIVFNDITKNINNVIIGDGYLFVNNSETKTFTTPSWCEYIDIKFGGGAVGEYTISNLQLEQGSTATTYEPYKSNILTVNEDVTLRSNGSVYDELDLLTGKLTQRIGEDGSVLTQEVVKTVDLTSLLDKPFEETNHYQVSSDTINPTFVAEVPIVSEGEQTLAEINQATYQNL